MKSETFQVFVYFSGFPRLRITKSKEKKQACLDAAWTRMNVAESMVFAFKNSTEWCTFCSSETEKTIEMCAAEVRVFLKRDAQCEVAISGRFRKTQKSINISDTKCFCLTNINKEGTGYTNEQHKTKKTVTNHDVQ